MNLKTLLDDAIAKTPVILDKLPEQQGMVLLRSVFKRIQADINRIEDGMVKIDGFGVFHIRMVDLVKDGVKKSEKRIYFMPIHPRIETSANIDSGDSARGDVNSRGRK